VREVQRHHPDEVGDHLRAERYLGSGGVEPGEADGEEQ